LPLHKGFVAYLIVKCTSEFNEREIENAIMIKRQSAVYIPANVGIF